MRFVFGDGECEYVFQGAQAPIYASQRAAPSFLPMYKKHTTESPKRPACWPSRQPIGAIGFHLPWIFSGASQRSAVSDAE